MDFTANMVTQTVIGVPSAEYLVTLLCPAARRALGPGALVGRIREPDSDSAAVGARVSFVWYDPDPPGLPSGLKITKKPPRVREATVAADGTYRLCGLPEKYEGKLQAQRKDGGETAEVTVSQELGVLALRSMSVAARPRVIAAGDTGAAKAPRGTARVSGTVVNRNGAPVANARVGLMGSSAATMTRANGEFVLDSLPAGTQALVVRQLGYSPTEVPVELSARTPARVTVKLGVLVPQLSPVEVISRREEGLQKVGYLDRKRTSAGGFFISPEDIERRKALRFSDVLRNVPGLQVSESNGSVHLHYSRAGRSLTAESWSPGTADDVVAQPRERGLRRRVRKRAQRLARFVCPPLYDGPRLGHHRMRAQRTDGGGEPRVVGQVTRQQ